VRRLKSKIFRESYGGGDEDPELLVARVGGSKDGERDLGLVCELVDNQKKEEKCDGGPVLRLLEGRAAGGEDITQEKGRFLFVKEETISAPSPSLVTEDSLRRCGGGGIKAVLLGV